MLLKGINLKYRRDPMAVQDFTGIDGAALRSARLFKLH